MQVNAGLGFSSGWGLPLYAGVDYGVTNDITVGAQLSYASSSNSIYNYNWKETWIGLGINGNYHFNTVLELPNKYDVYAGATLAYNNLSYNYPKELPKTYRIGNDSGVGFRGQIGGRYFFNDKFALNLEFGGGNIAVGGKLGITYKF